MDYLIKLLQHLLFFLTSDLLVTSVRRWHKLSDIPMNRRAEKVLRTLGWELQVDFEHLPEELLASERYLEAIISVIELKAGVRAEDEERSAFRGIMMENSRRRDESLSQYVNRRTRDFTKAALYGIVIPEPFKASMLKEGAGLTEQGLQNLTALLQGRDGSADHVAAMLARMDVRTDRITAFAETGDASTMGPSYLAQKDEDTSGESDGDVTPEEVAYDENVLYELTSLDFTEDQAALVARVYEAVAIEEKRAKRKASATWDPEADIIGLPALQALEDELARSGLQALEVPTTSTAPSGIGDSAKVSKTVLVPISPGGIPGVVQFVVIENNVPPLLSVRLLEHLGAQMDLVSNREHFRKIGVDMKMTNLPTGHRAIPLVEWTGGKFPVPEAAKEQFSLDDDAFMKAATGTVSAPASRWRQLVVRMMYLVEAIRTRYFRLAERENRDKSILSDRRSFLVADAQKPASCLHPPPHIRRANQYATWTVCSKCGARQTYVSKRVPAAKGKARARPTTPAAAVDATPDVMVGAFQPPTRSTVSTARSSRDPRPEPVHPELSATLQAMAISFQNVGETLRELTRGQSQMLTMMQQNATQGLDHLTALEAQARARDDLQEMQVDTAETEEWSPVTENREENPNADDLPRPRHLAATSSSRRQKHRQNRWCCGMNYLTALERHATMDLETLTGTMRIEHFVGVALGVYGFFMNYVALEPEEVEAKVDDREVKRAAEALVRLARQEQRAISGSQVDLAEVFRQTSATTSARARGMAVPVEHENFTLASGWDVTNKEHRRRLRHFLDHRKPQVVSMTWKAEDVNPDELRRDVKSGLMAALALEIAKHQCSHGRSFYIRAPVPLEPWKNENWEQHLCDHGRRVRVSLHQGYLTATDLGEESDETESEEAIDDTGEAAVFMTEVPGSATPDAGEKLAIKLIEESDYSNASCLRLLRETNWPRQRIKRPSMRGSEAYQVLGQYSYGKFAGITLATYRLPYTLKYLNHFMTTRGALGPRSSLVVSRNASVGPHKDNNNIGQNYSIAIGQFKGGELWEEDPAGLVVKEIKGVKVPGRLRKHHGKLNIFDPRKFHSVEPWTGERWSITAFQTRSAAKLGREQEELLAKFGFQVQGYSETADLPSSRASSLLVSRVESRSIQLDEKNVEELNRPERNGPDEAEPRVSQHQKDLVRKLHINTGHLPLERIFSFNKVLTAPESPWQNFRAKGPMVFGDFSEYLGNFLTSDETGLPVLNDAFHDPAGMDEVATEFKHCGVVSRNHAGAVDITKELQGHEASWRSSIQEPVQESEISVDYRGAGQGEGGDLSIAEEPEVPDRAAKAPRTEVSTGASSSDILVLSPRGFWLDFGRQPEKLKFDASDKIEWEAILKTKAVRVAYGKKIPGPPPLRAAHRLDDAPAAWRNTVVNYLTENNFVRNLVEPCWYMRFDKNGENEAQILIEVDDFIVSAKPEVQQQIKDLLSARFEFDKWEEDAAEYAGRKVQCLNDRVLIDQHKYITEQIFPIPLAKHRKAQKEATLTDEEFQAM
ncbi:unnamed protein product, partial [Symbiodinium necroappetens]